MKQTVFYECHKALNAKLVNFADYEMPIQYSSIIDEHNTVRNSVGVFDVSHMGEFIVKGKNAFDFLQKVTINDLSSLKNGKVQYTAMCMDNAGIIDDLLVYKFPDKYMLVVNASNMEKDFAWLESQKNGDVELQNISDKTAMLAIQGPKSLSTLQKLVNVDLQSLEYYTFVEGTVCGHSAIISRTGYTGELGFELYLNTNKEQSCKLWNDIFEAGKEFGIKPIGLGARDTLRLEMGYCLYGHEIDSTTNPLEAGLGWITKLNKTDFIGKNELIKIKSNGIKRRLVGFTLKDKVLARNGYQVKHNGKTVGYITSGTFSPSLQQGIATGYISYELAKKGNEVCVDIRGKESPATIVDLPFLKK